MKIIVHSNGNPFNLNGGYNEQIRFLLKMFYEEGHDVYFLNSGMLQEETVVKSYTLPEISEKWKSTPEKELGESFINMLTNINYLAYANKQPFPPHFIPVSKINEFINYVQADHLISLCDVLIMIKDCPEFNCSSTAWWPCHYNPPDKSSCKILPLFTTIVTLCPSVETILSKMYENKNKNITTCPHIIKTLNYRSFDRYNTKSGTGKNKNKNKNTINHNEIREKYEIPIDSYMCLINAANTERSNRKSFDTTFIAFKEYLDINPNAFLYINSPCLAKKEINIEFLYPNGHVLGTPLPLKHPQYGNITVPTDDQEYLENTKYNKNITITVPRHSPAMDLLDLIQQLDIPIDRFKLNNVALSDNELNDIYNTSDVLLTAHRSEGFGLPILEAQALGIPVITTKFLAMEDYTYYGISVPPLQLIVNSLQMGMWAMPDSSGIAKALDTINKWDHKEHHKLATNAKFIIENTMSYQAVKHKFIELINKTTNVKSSQSSIQLRDILTITGTNNIHLIGSLDKIGPFIISGDSNNNNKINIILHNSNVEKTEITNFTKIHKNYKIEI